MNTFLLSLLQIVAQTELFSLGKPTSLEGKKTLNSKAGVWGKHLYSKKPMKLKCHHRSSVAVALCPNGSWIFTMGTIILFTRHLPKIVIFIF